MVTIPPIKGEWLGDGANGIVLPTSNRDCNIIPCCKSENFECDLHLALHGIMMIIHRIRWRKWAIMGNLSWANPGVAYQLVSGAIRPELGNLEQLITKNPKFQQGLGLHLISTWIGRLVGGLDHLLFVHSVGNVIIPTDELIFFRGVGSTTNQKMMSKQAFWAEHERMPAAGGHHLRWEVNL